MPGRLTPAVIFVVGPTATGKTRLSIRLAKLINGEIVSADSMQVYKDMPILSQAPGRARVFGIKHHLVSILDVSKEYNVNIFRNRATAAIKAILRRGKVPIVTGGSGLYIKALIDGLFPSPEADMAFRTKMQKFIKLHGSAKAHDKLAGIDPESAKNIHPNDARRIIRALELYNVTGRTMTELKQGTVGLKDEFRIKMFGLRYPREEMYRNIETRVDRMFDDGIVAEVRKLSRKKMSRTSAAALGVKEVLGYLNGDYGLAEAKAILKKNTRRFAKRQLTWFRPDRRIRWFDLGKVNEKKAIAGIIKESAL
jgi:tRNA dimethylallyltransferase